MSEFQRLQMNWSRGESTIPTYRVEEEEELSGLYNRAPLCKKSLEPPQLVVMKEKLHKKQEETIKKLIMK